MIPQRLAKRIQDSVSLHTDPAGLQLNPKRKRPLNTPERVPHDRTAVRFPPSKHRATRRLLDDFAPPAYSFGDRSKMSNPLLRIVSVTLKAVPAAALAAARNRCGLVGILTWQHQQRNEHKMTSTAAEARKESATEEHETGGMGREGGSMTCLVLS